MTDEAPPTVTQSALRGIACRCPRCGKGKLYAGFLDLRPNCEACGLDYAFIDAGDGPAIFIIMLAGAIVVTAALIDEVVVDRAAVSSQGGARPADRPRAEMTVLSSRRPAVTGFAIFTLLMVMA